MFEDALELAGKTGEPCDPDDPFVMQAKPEHGAAGASPYNGRADRVVQVFEDLLRCYKSAFDSRDDETLSSSSPTFR